MAETPKDKVALDRVAEIIAELRRHGYGSVTVKVQDGVIVSAEMTKRFQ